MFVRNKIILLIVFLVKSLMINSESTKISNTSTTPANIILTKKVNNKITIIIVGRLP